MVGPLVAMSWFRREDWEALRAVFDDVARYPVSYDEWQRRAEKEEAEVKRRGHRIRRIEIRPEALVAWCLERGYKIDSQARAQMAASLAMKSRDG